MGVLAVIAYDKAVEHLGASKAAVCPALFPAAALALGVPIAGEFPALVECIGALMATAGLTVAMGATGPGRKT
jgi:drug/metabolite transporter (DMT)-like permease